MADTVDRRGTRIDNTAPRGHDYIDTLTLRNAAGALLDMSLYAVRLRVWARGEASGSQPATITEGTGTATVRLPPAVIATLPFACWYDLAVIDNAGVVTAVAWGELNFTGID